MMELLAPAGGPETLRTAILYGADAVYLGGEMYGLRAKAKNFDREQLIEAVAYAHARGVRVHVTVNMIAHNQHLQGLEEYLLYLQEAGVDALIMADAGMISIAREVIPNMEIHLSTQASATNYATFNFWHKAGVRRVVCAREVSLEEIAEIREKTDQDLEIEAFAHGAMCISISGRCLLSNYLTGRDANLGACTHPCRWKYRLVEETRPGEYFPITEGEEGTYIFNSKDLCMIDYLEEMEKAGVCSIKIEGRMKSPLYVAMVIKAYRQALDDLHTDPELYRKNKPLYHKWLAMASHRMESTGFYLGRPTENEQIYETAEYAGEGFFTAVVKGKKEEGLWEIEQRGKFLTGEELMLVAPRGDLISFTCEKILNSEGMEVESAPHPMEQLYIRLPLSEEETGEGCVIIKRKNS